MNLTKTKNRKHLGSRTFCRLVFLAFNLPFLSEIDVGRYIEQWQRDGHSMQPLDGANRGSVIDRHLQASKHTIFGGKFTGEDKPGEHDSDTDDCDSEPEEGEQESEQQQEQGCGVPRRRAF